MRTFIAILLPEEVKEEIYNSFKELSSEKTSKLYKGKIVEKDNLHLTLKFLGELSEDKIKEVKEKLSEAVNEFSHFLKHEGNADFNAKLSGVGAFPKKDFVKVLWAGVKDVDFVNAGKQDKIKKLQEIIENNLYEVNIPKEKREFSSHVTVARIKAVKNKREFSEKIKEINVRDLEFPVEKFSLFKSELTFDGPLHERIKDFYLG